MNNLAKKLGIGEREVFVRLWHKEDKKFVQGKRLDQGLNIITTDLDYYNQEFEKDVTNLYIKSFSTGLKDKNGEEIYEGDVLQFFSKVPVNGFGEFENMFIITNKLGVGWCMGGEMKLTIHKGRSCLIVGNIFENPELIENA